MYKKLVCILLLISITLTACDRGAGNNVGGTPITKNKVVSNAPTTKPAVNAIFDYKSGEYRFSYSYNDNFGVLENSLAYKGEYYFMPTSILWIDANGKIKVLSNINLNKIQLSSYNKFIDFMKDNNDKFKVLYPNSAVNKVISVYPKANSHLVYMQTDKKQLLKYEPSTGTVDMVQGNIEDFNYKLTYKDNIIIALKIESTQELLKIIDVSNNIVRDGGTIPNASLWKNAQDKNSIIGSVDNVGSNMSKVVLTSDQSITDTDGESIPATIDRSYLCNTKDKTCTKDTQIVSVRSTFKVNDSLPSSVSNLFNTYAKSHNLLIDRMDSSFNQEGTTPGINWTTIGISTGVMIMAFTILGGLFGYYYNKHLDFHFRKF